MQEDLNGRKLSDGVPVFPSQKTALNTCRAVELVKRKTISGFSVSVSDLFILRRKVLHYFIQSFTAAKLDRSSGGERQKTQMMEKDIAQNVK